MYSHDNENGLMTGNGHPETIAVLIEFSEAGTVSAMKGLRPVILELLGATRDRLAERENWTRDNTSQTIAHVAAGFEIIMGKLGQPIRVGVTVRLVGRERVVQRLDNAIEIIRQRAAASA